jgi:hypothetical protein
MNICFLLKTKIHRHLCQLLVAHYAYQTAHFQICVSFFWVRSTRYCNFIFYLFGKNINPNFVSFSSVHTCIKPSFYRKNELNYQKDISMLFSIPPYFLLISIIKHEWRLASFKKWFLISSFWHASCYSCYMMPINKK